MASTAAPIGQAQAATPRTLFDFPSQPYEQSILAIATKTNISVGGVDPARCGAAAPAISGRYDAKAALRLLLKGSLCKVEKIDGETFRLSLKPVPEPAPQKAAEAPKDIIVIGYRRAETIGAAPAAVSVVAGDDLRFQNGDLAKAAALAPGLTATNLGAGRNKLFLRGLSDGVFTGRTQSSVGLYLDDAPITYDAPDPDLLLIDMARIEVLRGPQGALYGEGSISGVVRLETVRPNLEQASGFLNAGVGFVQHGSSDWRVAAMLNQPILRGKLGVRAVVYDDNAGGYIHDFAIDELHTNKSSRQGARVGATWRINPRWSLDGALTLQSIDTRNSQYVSGDLGRYARAVPTREPHDNDFSELAMTLNGETSIGKLKISLNHLNHQRHSQLDAGGATPFLAIPASGTLVYDEDHKVELTTQEISLVSPSDRRFRWLAGFYSAFSRERFQPMLTDLGGDRRLYDESRHDKIEDHALFGEVSYDLRSDLTLTAGLRESRIHHETASRVAEETPTGAIDRVEDHELKTTHLSHIAMLGYRPSEHVRLYVEASEGYRSGGFNTTRLAGADGDFAESYQGDELNNYEAGVKIALPAQGAHLNLAVFHVVWNNIQSDQIKASGLPITVNVGDGVNTGLEIEGDWRISDALDLHATGVFNEPRLTRPNPDYATDEDSGFPFISRYSGSLSADWRTHVGRVDIESSALLSYHSASHLNFGRLQNVTMGGFATLDLASMISFGRIEYALRVDNAANATGDSFAFGNPFRLAAERQSTPTRPRTFWLGATISY